MSAILCRGCGEQKNQKARGLCNACYQQFWGLGFVANFESVYRKSWATLEDYHFIRTEYGGSLQNIADRMGMKRESLRKALARQGIVHKETACTK